MARRALSFLRRMHRPLEWLGFFALTVWLLPTGLQGVLELQLLGLTVGWSLAGALVVGVIDALSSAVGTRAHGVADTDELRLRSLRLVGRVVVVYALVLAISARLVGEGTIYRWVWSTCWIAALPVFLVLVRWWRATVFERVARVRRKTPVQAWILRNSSGYESFFAAMVAAVHLFALGSYKTVRNWLAGFDLARRGHAYLFRRGLARQATEDTAAAARALPADAHASLSPARSGDTWISCPADTVAEAIGARIGGGQGGVVAVVGARGMGKSTLLRRLSQPDGAITLIDCRLHGVTAPESRREVMLLDDAHALVKPMLGGLAAFDDALGIARASGLQTLWVFAIDEAVWPFLRRARDARPIFDEVYVLESWSDESIGQLLLRRSEEAGLEPSFESLLGKLPPAADEIDKQEAVAAKREGYFRMVWDYVRGNPAMALEVWRSSLALDDAGVARVRPMRSPATDRLESLPDASLFVLRAVLQMAPASAEEVARATRLPVGEVENAFRYGQAHGVLLEERGKVRIAWAWMRSVFRVLERRHLLVGS